MSRTLEQIDRERLIHPFTSIDAHLGASTGRRMS